MAWEHGRIRFFNDKTSPPTVNDDENFGYRISDVWLDITNAKSYICLSAAAGSADWNQLDAGAGAGSGTMTSVKEATVLVDDEVETIDLNGDHFNITEDPIHEINITLANPFTATEKTKLGNIEVSATVDQTGAEIKTAYEAEVNAFTDTKNTKLAGIETAADVTDTANVNTAGAVMEVDFNAATFLYAVNDDTPVIKTRAEVLALLSGQASASFNMNSQAIIKLSNIVTVHTPAGAATATLDLDVSRVHDITMPAGNITIAVSNENNGDIFTIRILQDGTGSRTVTWFSTIKWAGGSAPTLTTSTNKADTFIFRVTGADTYDGFEVGLNI